MSMDPGLVVRGADGTDHVKSVDLVLTLIPHGKGAKQYRRHQLVLYTDNGDHALLVTTVDVEEKTTQTVRVCVRVKPRLPTLLLARWHAEAFDEEDEAWAQELVASGGAAGEEIPLLDINKEVQAMLTVQGWPFKEDDKKNDDGQLDALIQQVTRVHGSAFAKVSVHLGPVVRDVPVLFFALLTRKMAAPPAQATAYFEHVLRLATALAPSADWPVEQLLADALVLPSQAHWCYRGDKTRSGKNIDQWSSLWAFPPTKGLVAFDCEDGSIALMQLFLVLKECVLVKPSLKLQALQDVAKRYTPWLAINQLQSTSGSARNGVGGGTYVLHCCLLLLRADPADATAYPISIESTARCSGPWLPRGSRGVPAMIAAAKAHDKAQVRVNKFPEKDQAMAHVRAPIGVVHANGMYGELYALLTCSGPTSRHVLLPQGTDTATFLMRGGDAARGTYVINMPTAKLEAICQRELQLVPAPRFPSAPARPVYPAPGTVDASILLPACASVRGVPLPVTSDANVYLPR